MEKKYIVDPADYEEAIKKIMKKTKGAMKKLNTYRPQFDPAIRTYAEMMVQLDILTKRWTMEGCEIVEEYTTRTGATNTRKSTLYGAIEAIRRDIKAREDALGLTPYGLKKINDEMKKKEKNEGLGKILGAIDGI